MEALQEKLEGIKFMHTSRFVPHNGKHDDEVELEEMLIKILAFADDTTAVGKLKDKEMIDQCIQRMFADHAEKVHPGKKRVDGHGNETGRVNFGRSFERAREMG